MNGTIYITITGIKNYYGKSPFESGRLFKLEKEPDNFYDREAIKVTFPVIGTVGYVANSTSTVYGGTYSAGRLYDKMGNTAFAEVMFITHSSVIARLIDKEKIKFSLK